MGQPDTGWSMISVCLSHTLYFGSAPFFNIFSWKLLVIRLWSCTAMIKPSVSDSRYDKASHWWDREEFTSGSLVRTRYLPWRGLYLHPSFSSLTFLVFACVLTGFAFSVDEEFSETLSVLWLISFKYFFTSLVKEYMLLFSSSFFLQGWASTHLCCLNKCRFQYWRF